jgi:glycosyltransferase involved in cell wall biosynthesis
VRMSTDRVRVLEAAIDALREKNEVLEADRRLLGARVAELEERLVRVQRERDKPPPPPPRPMLVRVAVRVRRVLGRVRRALRLRRPTRSGADRGGGSADRPSGGGHALRTRDRAAPASEARRLKVLGVLDTMTATCFGEVVDLTLPGPGLAADVVRNGDFDLVLVESAWRGNDNSWQYHVGSYATPGYRGLPALRELVDTARKRGVPTVFWNKEDPVHFTKFAEASRVFDYIFTTDADRIGTYRALNGHAQLIEALQFAAQPSLHNPVGSSERSAAPVFAGTFYRRRYAHRQDGLRVLLEAALPYGLVIYDRMHGSGQAEFGFPESVADRVAGSLPYGDVVGEYKRHRVFLNANSVVASPTMFARRVFELLACGTAVVSTPSRGMTATFGDLVDSVDSAESARAALKRLLTDEHYWETRSVEGIRLVMLHHTYAHRLGQIARAAGLPEPEAGPSVALVCATTDEVRQLHSTIGRMRGVREVMIPSSTPSDVSGPLHATGSDVRRVVRFDPDATSPARNAAAAAARATSAWLVRASDVLRHDPTMLTDLAVATMFSPAPLVAARPGAARDQLYTVARPADGDILVRRTVDVARDRVAAETLIASTG